MDYIIVRQKPWNPITPLLSANYSIARVISARLLSYIDDIYPILRHIQNVLMKHESEGGGHQLQVDRATKKLIACIPETSRLRIQLSNDARAIAFNTFRNLVVLWGTYEQALEQLQPKYCHRPPTFDNEPTFRRTVNECTNLSEVQELLGTFASTDNSAKIKLSMSTRPSGCGRSQELHIHSVELTEHAATLQADDIYWWMRLTVKIMQYAQWLTDKDFAFGLYGKVCLGHLLELINFTRSGKEFYLRRLKELERMEKVARTGKVTTVEELGRIEEKPAPLHELARIDQIEGLEEDLARTEEKHAPIPWSPE